MQITDDVTPPEMVQSESQLQTRFADVHSESVIFQEPVSQLNRHGILDVFVSEMDRNLQVTSSEDSHNRGNSSVNRLRHITTSLMVKQSRQLRSPRTFSRKRSEIGEIRACPVRIQKHTYGNHWIKSSAEAHVSKNEVKKVANSLSFIASTCS